MWDLLICRPQHDEEHIINPQAVAMPLPDRRPGKLSNLLDSHSSMHRACDRTEAARARADAKAPKSVGFGAFASARNVNSSWGESLCGSSPRPGIAGAPGNWRVYPAASVSAFDADVAAGDNRTYLVLPPGAGKTMIGASSAPAGAPG